MPNVCHACGSGLGRSLVQQLYTYAYACRGNNSAPGILFAFSDFYTFFGVDFAPLLARPRLHWLHTDG